MVASQPVSGVTAALDWVMDKSLVLGYTKVGPALRRRWWPADPEPGVLTGRHVLVTGATGGLGLATARGLAGLGAVVHVTGRDAGRLDRARAVLLGGQPGATVETHVSDVSDLAGTAEFARDLAARVPRLHAVVHNAGVMPPQRTTTDEGKELALATHVLGPHVLTFGLRESLAAGGRVVIVTSGGAYAQRLDVDDPEFTRGTYSGTAAYARTKRMQLVLAPLWARELAVDGVTVSSMHPGWADTPGVTESLPGFAKVTGPLLRDAEQGADTAVWLAATGEPIPSGRFWHDRRQRAMHYAPVRVETPGEVERFWAFVCETTGVPGTAR
ncbi:SDR family NAD(P)-dependent oxidoreductase [Humibacillus xanthopallidus]|uniref:NAD(P)-dependent dehydrogenase (Short-subunit alcohol dehydrogenase family) n=1 Tax=Humibacillus xanthopallidus TaxID=412689 RepID=A0A543I057_9MICO|nr:SDR family NAD(P)-dependent oxidoreductase [Humibacillus xanthopallidus]TQM63974.1 NAD(P)-dependent dehydrogenase (short-subunit alcohol dehydrogenase family) [Humibacillus xanthopallidus]